MSNILEVILNLVDNLTPGIDEASGAMDNLSGSVDSASGSIDSIDIGAIPDVEAAAESAGTSLEGVQEAAAMAAAGIASIDPSPIQDTATAANDASSALSGMGEAGGEIGAMGTALAAMGIAEYVDSAVNAAGDFQDQWTRIGVVTEGVAQTASEVSSEWSGAISDMQAATGRSAGTIRTALLSLGIAGLESQADITAAFTQIANVAGATGYPIEQITNSFSRMVQQGNLSARYLRSMGIGMEDLQRYADSTGTTVDQLTADFKEMTPEMRAATLEAIMMAQYGTAGNDAYKMSWERVKDMMGAAFDYISRIVGGLILPVLIPAMEFFTVILKGVASALDMLPGPVKFILGVLLLLGLGFITVIGILGILFSVIIPGLITGINALNLTLMFLAMNPIVLVVLAIIILIAILYYLWTTNEGFRNAVINAWNTIKAAFMNAFYTIGSGLMWLIGRIWGFYAEIYAWEWSVINAAAQMVSGFMNYLWSLPGQVWNVLVSVGNQIMAIGGYWWSQAYAAASNIWAGFKAALGIASPSHLERAMFAIGDASNDMFKTLSDDASRIAGLNYGGGANVNLQPQGNNDRLTVELNHNFQNVPAGTDEKLLARYVAESFKDSTVADAMDRTVFKKKRDVLRPQGMI